jgi:hypothetical protein
MIREPLYDFSMSDIEYLIEPDRQTVSDKQLYITQLLPTRYSINITKTPLADINIRNNEYMYMRQITDRIFIPYTQGVRQMSDWIFIWHMQRSGGLLNI